MIHIKSFPKVRPAKILPFWAAALKGTMTYAFTHGEFSFPPSIGPSVHPPRPKPHQRGLSQAQEARFRPREAIFRPWEGFSQAPGGSNQALGGPS